MAESVCFSFFRHVRLICVYSEELHYERAGNGVRRVAAVVLCKREK